MRDRLYEDALVMSVNKNLLDVTTLIEWAAKAQRASDKIDHIEQAMLLLKDMRDQLVALKN